MIMTDFFKEFYIRQQKKVSDISFSSQDSLCSKKSISIIKKQLIFYKASYKN